VSLGHWPIKREMSWACVVLAYYATAKHLKILGSIEHLEWSGVAQPNHQVKQRMIADVKHED
jgi:hypothetical protein